MGERRMKQSLVVGLCVAFLYACGGSDGGTGTTLPPTAAEQFTQDLQGLSLDAFYDTSIATLVQRSPETLGCDISHSLSQSETRYRSRRCRKYF